MMNWKERVCADCYGTVPEFAFGTPPKYGGGITPGASHTKRSETLKKHCKMQVGYLF
jgi:hypothetical protein